VGSLAMIQPLPYVRSASMSEINKKHNTFFRETMSHKEVAADFLANYLPAKVLRHLRLDTLAVCS
jgi:hypothetical protein